MSTSNNYSFYNAGRTENDSTVQTQQNMQNDRYADYTTTNYFSENATDAQVSFATQQPAVMPSSDAVGSNTVESESDLLLKTDNERALGRLNLMERPYLTVPYLGRGSVDPTLELRLQEGEPMMEKKSTSTVMAQSFMGYTMYPTNGDMESRVSDASHTVEESAMRGWVRGGATTRAAPDDELASKGRPSNKSF